MKITDQICDPQTWKRFWEYRLESRHISQKDAEDLYLFYRNEEYLKTVELVKCGGTFNPPTKKTISKIYSEKKRIVYTFNREENYVLKLITYLLIRKYDNLFAPNLYSFRLNNGAHTALPYLTSGHRTDKMYVYKTDISNYFNSVDVTKLLPILSEILVDDADLFVFIKNLLEDPRVVDNGQIVEEKKGIMAGCPLAAFLANVYLRELDWSFYKSDSIYARYSDDIIIFSPTLQIRDVCIQQVKNFLQYKDLTINTKKEQFVLPGGKWEFLGFSYSAGKVDISDVSAEKLKKKMRRKARALIRWKNKKGADGPRAARAFIKVFNKKLFDNPVDDELTWSRWYFPIINTVDTLREIDHYEQDCIRYIATEKRTKSRFNFSYGDMKKLGYRGLVHEYYRIHKDKVKAEKNSQKMGND